MTLKNISFKIIALLLALVCLLCSCTAGNTGSDESTQTEAPETENTFSSETEEDEEEEEKTTSPESEEEEEEEEKTTSPESESESEKAPEEVLVGDQSENENYKQITPRNILKFKYISFLTEKTQEVLCLKVPLEWSVKKTTDSSYTISLDNTEIGALFLGKSTDFNEWQTVNKEESDAKNFNITQCIDKYGQGDTLKFRYRYCAESIQDSSVFVTLTVDYAELNSKAAHNIFKQSTFELRSEIFNIGTVPEAKNGSVLIIGNSFIDTSKIGGILSEMMRKNNKNSDVIAISRGMATVETYVNDYTLMGEIQNGEYAVVFVCGFYSTAEIENLKAIKSKCDKSNTKLVVFPAHNEASTVIKRIKDREKDILILNWQNELNTLIADGRNLRDFCVDDYYNHSTEIAGYVGAHMIYRAIYGEIPTARLSTTIKQSQVNAILGEYVTTGCANGALYTLK